MVRWIIDVVVAAVLIVAVLVACDRMPSLGPIGGAPPTNTAAKPVVAPNVQSPGAPTAPAAAPTLAPAAGPTSYPYPYPAPQPPAPVYMADYPYPSPTVK